MTDSVKSYKKKSKSNRSGNESSRATRSSSSSVTRQDSRHLQNEKHDDDVSSVSTSSTSSTYSAIRSILERRRRIRPPLSIVQEEGDDQGTANGVFHHASSSRSINSRRSNNSQTSKASKARKRQRNSSHNNAQYYCLSHRRRSIHPILLFLLVGLASNWMASRILNSKLNEEIDADTNIVEMTLNIESERDMLQNGEALAETERNVLPRSSSIHARNPSRRSDVVSANNYTNRSNRQNANGGSGDLTQMTERRISRRSSLTKRFSNLRRRLISLYSENVPSESLNSSDEPHPLYNSRSPQYQALDWLANIDELRLRHNDVGLVQRYVLAVMYFSTGGPPVDADTDLSQRRIGPWRNPTNFLAPTHECDWKSRIIDGAGRGGGIRRCDRNKTVVEISLYNELKGPIPSELGRLWNLRTLYLGRNQLTSTIPTELGMIQKLSSLSLQWNDLSGTIPEEHLKNLLTLRALQLEGNEKIGGKIARHSFLCQMRNKYRGPTPRDQEKYTGRRVLRILTATCIPAGSDLGGRLECACCTECFGKKQKDLIYQR